MNETRQFRFPWEGLSETGSNFAAELKKEVGPGHPLFGCEVTAIARAVDSDDVLFSVSLPSTPWAVVHLTWRGQQEVDSTWPHVELLSSISSLLERPSNS
jgi:hypothetical protein